MNHAHATWKGKESEHAQWEFALDTCIAALREIERRTSDGDALGKREVLALAGIAGAALRKVQP